MLPLLLLLTLAASAGQAAEVDNLPASQGAAGQEEAAPDEVPEADAAGPAVAEAQPMIPAPWGPITILGKEVAPGERRDFFLLATESFAGASVRTPVVVTRGARPGVTVCLTAGIHGDELNGVEIVRELIEDLDPVALSGTVIGVPIVNLHGFQRSSRYLPDRRDLNRYFPGDPNGSSASRIADALFNGVISECDALIDFHSGSLHRSNMPQVRGDLTNEGARNLARAFGSEVVVHNPGRVGTLRRAAMDAGIPAIVYEAGEPMRFQKREIERGVAGLRNLLQSLGALDGRGARARDQKLYYESHWVRADRGGILVANVDLGERVKEGEILGTVADPLRRGRMVIVSPYSGQVIGMTLAPVVIPGDATFHIGVRNGEMAEAAEPSERKPAEPPGEEEERPE